MCCIFMALVLLGPRFSGFAWWFFQAARWDEAFSSFVWPLLGLLFVPWTTIMFVGVQPHGVTGVDWLFLSMAFLGDIACYGGGYQNRQRAPGYPYVTA